MALVTVKMLGEAAWMTFARNKFSDEFDKVTFARDMRNYDDVVSFTVGLEGEEAAEEAFDLSNNPSRQANRDIIWGERLRMRHAIGSMGCEKNIQVNTGA